MNNELPGVTVPAEVMDRMRAARDAEHAMREGVDIAASMLAEISSLVDGVQISAPFNRISLALDVVGKGLKS
jgi:5,10-methylenetetrahydrofolate reductase